MMGEGHTYQARQKLWFRCLEYSADLTVDSLVAHCQNQNGVGRGYQGEPPSPPEESQLYQVSLPWTATIISFPVEGCHGWAMIRTNIRIHFVCRHVQDTIVIMEEGGP